jgi:TatD DNase family protein
MLFDTHCHVNLYSDVPRLIREIEEQAIEVTLVTTEPELFPGCVQLIAHAPHIQPALGLLPHEIHRLAPQVECFLEFLPQTRFVGEVGLDYVTEDDAERRLQRSVFDRILSACAEAGDKIISIHSRRAADAVIERVGRNFPGTVILHWFSGSPKNVASAENCYFSVNLAMIKSRSGKKLIRAMDPAFILTETDGPFVEVACRPARPSDIRKVINFFSRDWGCSHAEAEARVAANAIRAGLG